MKTCNFAYPLPIGELAQSRLQLLAALTALPLSQSRSSFTLGTGFPDSKPRPDIGSACDDTILYTRYQSEHWSFLPEYQTPSPILSEHTNHRYPPRGSWRPYKSLWLRNGNGFPRAQAAVSLLLDPAKIKTRSPAFAGKVPQGTQTSSPPANFRSACAGRTFSSFKGLRRLFSTSRRRFFSAEDESPLKLTALGRKNEALRARDCQSQNRPGRQPIIEPINIVLSLLYKQSGRFLFEF